MRNPLYRRLAWGVLTLGPVGTVLPAPGTWGSLCAALALAFLQPWLPVMLGWRAAVLCLAAVLVAAVGTLLLRRYARSDAHVDHPSIVLDEVAGMLVAAVPGGLWEQGTVVHLAIAFAFFRLFDIFKPLGIRTVDRRGTAASVFLDDLLAGAYAALALTVLLLLVY